MSSESQQTAPASLDISRTPASPALLKSFMQRMLRKIDCDEILLQTPGGRRVLIGGKRSGEQAHVTIHRWKCMMRLLTSGDLGFAEGYLAGEWSTPNIHSFLSAAGRRSNDALSFEGLEATAAPDQISSCAEPQYQARQPPQHRGALRSRQRFLSVVARFQHDRIRPRSIRRRAKSLEDAQRTKLDRVIDRLGLSGGERVLEIGCGWGGLAERIIERTGSHVTGLTLSTEQLAYARQQLARRGFAGQSDLRLQDYRDVGGTYDRVVSVEMLEAVGEAYWPIFFDNLRQRLNPQGAAVLQVITIDQSRFESYRRRPEFIQRYIFPGGMLPTTEILEQQIAKAGLRLVSSEFFGDSYARTLAEWHARFLQAWPCHQRAGVRSSLQADVGILSGLLPARLRNRRPECRAL